MDVREPCRNCWARYLCGGGCYYQAVLTNGDISKPDLAKCNLIRYLASEAVRLVTILTTQAPKVLSALPTPYYIRKEDLYKPLDHLYLPEAGLRVISNSEITELITPERIQGTLLSVTSPAVLKMSQRDGNLELDLIWNDDLPVSDIRFWFLDLERDPFLMGDLPVVKAHMKGILLRLDKDENLWQLIPPIDSPVRPIPYKEPVWRAVFDVPAQCYKRGIHVLFPLQRIFNGEIPRPLYGFNLFIDFLDGGCWSLVRYEPFCLISAMEEGALKSYGGEFQLVRDLEEELNASRVTGMEPLGRWTELHANVC